MIKVFYSRNVFPRASSEFLFAVDAPFISLPNSLQFFVRDVVFIAHITYLLSGRRGQALAPVYPFSQAVLSKVSWALIK
jgi:hypothetical protein